MKKITYVIAIAVLGLMACKGNENKGNTSTESQAATTDTTAVQHTTYTCPMHPEVASDKPGTCPQCGMDLEVKS